ncbi:hypothetical protein LZ012_04390 [Dechloromonas sp. XY25]|uniref:DUF1269 domain-containing protein n=1 Tax=Dechloromonas hankyongensis TaxID=2908002 RepID=A0ABS9JZA1_9RHOO|nr:hypothetical protein [Dechloromonas hankyongensis]MCG2576230.1 hypothetical protein [Dechloromonas hankyongensis]
MTEQVLAGIYASRPEAERVCGHLQEGGLPSQQMQVVERVRADDFNPQLMDADRVLKDVLVDGIAGTILGTGIGAVGEAVLALANVTLFTASPLIAPLAMIGWGAALGGLMGAAMGANGVNKQGRLSDVLLYAIRRGHVTLIAHVRNEQEQLLANREIGLALVQGRGQRTSDTRH